MKQRNPKKEIKFFDRCGVCGEYWGDTEDVRAVDATTVECLYCNNRALVTKSYIAKHLPKTVAPLSAK